MGKQTLQSLLIAQPQPFCFDQQPVIVHPLQEIPAIQAHRFLEAVNSRSIFLIGIFQRRFKCLHIKPVGRGGLESDGCLVGTQVARRESSPQPPQSRAEITLGAILRPIAPKDAWQAIPLTALRSIRLAGFGWPRARD